MKRISVFVLSLAAVLCLMAAPASADLYNNGPDNGQFDAWTINNGFSAASSFTANGTATGVSFLQWVFPGDAPTGVDWAIGGFPTDNSNGGGTAGLSSVNLGYNGFGYSLFESSFSVPNIALAGSYWLTLSNATTAFGQPTYWDINNGPSSAWESYYGYVSGNCPLGGGISCSTSFEIQGGGGGTTPEPSSLLLFGSGLLSLGGVLRRKLGK